MRVKLSSSGVWPAPLLCQRLFGYAVNTMNYYIHRKRQYIDHGPVGHTSDSSPCCVSSEPETAHLDTPRHLECQNYNVTQYEYVLRLGLRHPFIALILVPYEYRDCFPAIPEDPKSLSVRINGRKWKNNHVS